MTNLEILAACTDALATLDALARAQRAERQAKARFIQRAAARARSHGNLLAIGMLEETEALHVFNPTCGGITTSL